MRGKAVKKGYQEGGVEYIFLPHAARSSPWKLSTSWNDTAITTRFNNASSNLELRLTLKEVLRKFVFFAEDKNVLANFTEQEDFIFSNYGKYIPTLMQQV